MMLAMARDLDLTLVRTFVTVADRASMTAAAHALSLTQGAVSQQVKRLEHQFGAALFERDRPGLRLTAVGERSLGKARRLLSLSDELTADMAAPVVDGALRFGAPYDLMGACVAPILKGYADAHGKVEVSLTSASSPELLAALAKGDLDLALVEEPLEAAAGERLRIEQLVWVGAKGGDAHLKRPLPVSLGAATCAFRPAVLAALDRRGIAWRTAYEGGGIEAAMATVRAGLAVSAWLASVIPSDLDILTTDAGLPALPPFAINLHASPGRATAATAALARHVRSALVRSIAR